MPVPLILAGAAPALSTAFGVGAGLGSAGVGAAALGGGTALLGGGAAAAGGAGLFSTIAGIGGKMLPGLLSAGSGALAYKRNEIEEDKRYAAAMQDYLNSTARQEASDQFARWTASTQAKTQDLNNSYSYWQQQINYGQELAYTNQLRNFELTRSINQAEVVFRTRSSAMANYANQSGALVEGLAQQSMADAVSLMQYKQQALRAQGTVGASLNEGQSSDRYINDYARQAGDMAAMKQLNEQFREQQFTREQAGLIANYLNEYNSQQMYEEQEYMDPIMPYPPLPTLVQPGGPSFIGNKPMRGNSFLSSAIAGVSAGINTYNNLSKYTNSGRTS